MESLNMNNLARSLPSSTVVKAEQDTMDRFKEAAHSITLLLRSSQRASKRNFDAGYAAALDDLLSVIQHGVSAGSDLGAAESGTEEGMTIGRVLDWIEARQEGIRIRAREDEEDEEEKEARNRSGTSKTVAGTSGTSDTRDKTKVRSTEHTASSPRSPGGMSTRLGSQQPMTASTPAPASSPSPSLSAPSPIIQCCAPSQPSSSARPQTRARLRAQHVLAPLNATSGNTSNSVSNSALPPAPSVASVLGAKRRHAAMLLDAFAPTSTSVSFPESNFSGASTPTALSSSSAPRHSDNFAFSGSAASSTVPGQRRRIRNPRVGGAPRSENTAFNDGHGFVSADAMMDIEDEGGRERKRVARR